MARSFRARALTTKLLPSALSEKLRLCILNTTICLGWTQCRLHTTYCGGWLSWCRFYTLINCDPRSWVACQDPSRYVNCGPGSPVVDPGDILVDPEIYVRQLAELKSDLTQALAQLEAHQKEISDLTKGG
jgi:hypothetical protein